MRRARATGEPDDPLLQVRDVSCAFALRRRGLLRRQTQPFLAVDGVSFDLHRGEALGIVGESGCGKTTLARMIATALRPSAGQILLRGPEGDTDIATADRSGLRTARRRIQMVFQDPFSSLNPRLPVVSIVGEPLRVNMGLSGRALRVRVGELLELVGLNPRFMDRYPHAFSGGQRQRIGLARALALDPQIIVADEPVSALDVSVQAQILNLFDRLRRELGLTCIFISHDLAVVEHLCERVLVMYCGRVIEAGPTASLFDAPAHPYLESLIAAAPSLTPGTLRVRRVETGEVADPANRPAGCAFHPRCPYASSVCRQTKPEFSEVIAGIGTGTRRVACHFSDSLDLVGVRPSPQAILPP